MSGLLRVLHTRQTLGFLCIMCVQGAFVVGGNQSSSLFSHIMQNSANGSHTAMWAGAKVLAIAKLGELEGLAHLAWLPAVPV